MHIDKKLMHRIFTLIAGAIVFAWLVLDTARATQLFSAVWDLFAPFVVGAGIAFIFNVPMRAIERQLEGMRNPGARRTLSVLLTIFCLVLIIMFVFELLVPQIRLTATSLSEKIPAFVDRTAAKLMVFMDDNPELKAWIMESTNLESLDWASILKDALAFVGNKVSNVMGGAVNVIGSVTTGLVNLVISVVFAIYCLGRKEILARQGRRLLYSIISESRADEVIRVVRLTNVTFSNFISGQCLEAVILGCLFAVVMSILKMPYVPLVSVVIAVTALVPIVGAFAGCVLGAFFILVQNPVLAFWFVVMFLILQQIEGNLIYPRVVGSSIGLPGMWVLVAVAVGGDLMGVAGMLIMIPLASVMYTLAREITTKRLQERGIDPEKLRDHPPELTSKFKEQRQKNQAKRQEKKAQRKKKRSQDSQENAD